MDSKRNNHSMEDRKIEFAIHSAGIILVLCFMIALAVVGATS